MSTSETALCAFNRQLDRLLSLCSELQDVSLRFLVMAAHAKQLRAAEQKRLDVL